MKIRGKSVIRWGVSVVALASLLQAPLKAGAESTALEEIVVTAQKREQNLQDVGVSVTAIGAEQIRALGVTSSTDLGRVAPGVVMSPTGADSYAMNLSVRGIAQSDYTPTQESPNSLYLDDVYLSTNTASGFATYDLARIEVLRGPQGTLFGRNAIGGLANLITAKPTKTFEAFAEAGYGSFSNYWVEGAVSGPFTDRVRGRLSFRGEQADGWWKNYAPGGKDSRETKGFGVRAQLETDVTDNMLARLSLSYAEQPRHRAGTYKSRNFYLDANGIPTPQPSNLDVYGTGPGNNLIGYRDPYSDNRSSAFEDYGFVKTQTTIPILFLQWSLGSTTLTSITSYLDLKIKYKEEDDGSTIDFTQANTDQWLKQWSQEFRANGKFGANEWTAGLYYLDIDTFARQDFLFPIFSGGDFAYNDYQDMRQRTQSWAPFGQIEWPLSDKVRLTTGIRYTKDRKTFDSQVYFRELGNGYSGGTGSTVFPPPGFLVYDFRRATVGDLARQNEGLWSGKLQLDIRPAQDTLLYASISRGVKGAGFNSNLGGTLALEDTPFKSESVLTYEVGEKLDLLDRRLRLNTSIYYYDYKGYQGYAFNGLQGIVRNYKGKFYGGELEIEASLPGDVRVNLAGSYSHSLIKNIPSAYMGIRDEESPMAPQWIANGFVRKAFRLGEGSLALNWSFDYLSDRYMSVDNNPATHIDGSIVHNLKLTYDLEKSGLEFAAFVNNVADKDRQVLQYDLVPTGGYVLRSYDKPRWWGVSVRKSF